VNKDEVHSRTYIFNSYSDGASNRDGEGSVHAISSSMITLSGGGYGMPHSTKDEEMLRGFSETLSEGVLWETGGTEMELCSINLYFSSYTVCLSLPQDWFKHYE